MTGAGDLTDDPAAGHRRAAHAVVMASFAGPVVPDWIVERIRAGLGAVCLFGSNLTGDDAQARALTDALHAVAPGPDGGVLVAVDEEGGDVTRLDAVRGSLLPSPAALGLVDDVALTRRVAAGLARRLRSVGIDLDLAPDADVNADPRNPVIGVRSFGAAPHVVARHVTATVAGLQDGGVAACAKHFPGHGDTAVDSHTGLPEVAVPLDVLRARELVPFAAAVAAGVEAVMTGHLVVPALDPAGPASTSARVTALLRDELGFTGLIVTDALDMAGVSGPDAHGGLPAAAVAALAAGADLLCLGADRTGAQVAEVVEAVAAAVDDGTLPAPRLAEAAGRVRALARLAAHRRASRAPAVDAVPADAVPADAVPADAVQADGAAAAEVARRAVRVTGPGPVPELHTALVLRWTTAASIAVGPVPWGLAAEGARRLPGAEFADVTALDVPALLDRLAAEPGRAVVAVVRDAVRSPWVLSGLDALARLRPGLVVVELGGPGDEPLPGATVVRTATASRAGARAALDALEALAGRR